MDVKIGITGDHKCMFNWCAFEAQFNKANKFPSIINIIVLTIAFWFLKSNLSTKTKSLKNKTSKGNVTKNEPLVLFFRSDCFLKSHMFTVPLPFMCQTIANLCHLEFHISWFNLGLNPAVCCAITRLWSGTTQLLSASETPGCVTVKAGNYPLPFLKDRKD